MATPPRPPASFLYALCHAHLESRAPNLDTIICMRIVRAADSPVLGSKRFVLSLDLRLIAGMQACVGSAWTSCRTRCFRPCSRCRLTSERAIGVSVPWIILALVRQHGSAASTFIRWNVLGTFVWPGRARPGRSAADTSSIRHPDSARRDMPVATRSRPYSSNSTKTFRGPPCAGRPLPGAPLGGYAAEPRAAAASAMFQSKTHCVTPSIGSVQYVLPPD